MEADVLVRGWIAQILQTHPSVMRIATRQRAKFEGWLKFELAAVIEQAGMKYVGVEVATNEIDSSRGDISFSYEGVCHHLELKTCNTNFQIPGVFSSNRPITKNLASIVMDARKLQSCKGRGIVAACIFPIAPGDTRWHNYLVLLAQQIMHPISVAGNATTVRVEMADSRAVDVAVISFVVDSKCQNT